MCQSRLRQIDRFNHSPNDDTTRRQREAHTHACPFLVFGMRIEISRRDTAQYARLGCNLLSQCNLFNCYISLDFARLFATTPADRTAALSVGACIRIG